MKLAVSHSLRGRLLWFLLAAITLAALVQAAIAYRSALSDADQIFDYHMQQMALSLRSGAPLSNQDAQAPAADPENDDLVVQVWTPDGVQVFRSISHAALPQRAVLGFSNVKANGTTYRIFSVQTSSQTVQVAQDMAVRKQMAGNLALRTVAPVALMAPVLMLVVWWVVSRSLAPVARVRRQVAARQADDLSPVSESGLPDEVLPLVHELNLLFGRVKTAFDAQQNFVADAAHELRSPLAALKLQVLSLERASDGSEARALALSRLTAGIERATRLVEQLLVLARQQASATNGNQLQPLDLGELLKRTIGDMVGAAQARKIDLGLVHADAASVAGQADALIVLLRNLVDNAIKYTPPGGTVDLALRRTQEGVCVTVEDSGPGIAPDERERVFSRFYRVPGSGAGGSGLGLAIIKEIAAHHGATVTLDQSARLGGLSVRVLFPAPRPG